jgi:uncharacterized membrane protein YbhN (UPF0104 family)
MSRWWRWGLGVVVLAAGARYAVRFPWTDTWTTLASADRGLLAAAGVANLLSLACKAGGWHLLLRRFVPARVRTTQAATFAGAAVGSVGIALSGEAVRLQVLTLRDGIGVGVASRSIAASRVVEAAALGVLLIAVAGGAAASHGALAGWRLVAGAVALGAGAVALLRRARWTLGQLVAPLALAVVSWLLQWTTYHWSIAAAHVAVTRSASGLVLLLSNLGGIFRLTPGNVGIVQGAVVLGLRPDRVPVAQAVAAGVALQAVQVLPVVAIGIVILARHGLRRALA